MADEKDADVNDVDVACRAVGADDDRLDHPQVDEGRDLPHACRHPRADTDRQKRQRPQRQCRPLAMAEPGRQRRIRLPAHTGDDDIERDCQIRHAHPFAVRTAEQGMGELVEAQGEHSGQPVAAAPPLRAQDGAVGHRFGPLGVLVDRHRQFTGHQAADDRPERRADHVVGHLAGRQQPLHAADVDEARAPAAAEDGHQLLVADLGVEFRRGEVAAVALDEHSTLIVLVVDQRRQHVFRALQRRDRIGLLAQRCVQRVDDPGPPRRDLAAHRDVPATAASARPRGPRFEVGQPGEIEDVAQLAQLFAAQHVRIG